MRNLGILPNIKYDGVVVQELNDELLVFDLASNHASCLNRTAVQIMERCDGHQSAVAAADELGLPVEMVWATVEEFRKAGLLSDGHTTSFTEAPVSRRKLLKQAVALGVAVPLVSSLVAPSAVHAASCIRQNQPCLGSNDTNCCPGATCINLEQGPTGFVCFGCIPAGAPCSVGGTPCCNGGFCAPVGGVPVCQVIG